jgi:hypothetical protein
LFSIAIVHSEGTTQLLSLHPDIIDWDPPELHICDRLLKLYGSRFRINYVEAKGRVGWQPGSSQGLVMLIDYLTESRSRIKVQREDIASEKAVDKPVKLWEGKDLCRPRCKNEEPEKFPCGFTLYCNDWKLVVVIPNNIAPWLVILIH